MNFQIEIEKNQKYLDLLILVSSIKSTCSWPIEKDRFIRVKILSVREIVKANIKNYL
jgi:hypothetical protein